MTNQDTITVELPIKAEGDWVHVAGVSADRDRWREVAVDPSSAMSERTRVLAPAVVAWIERDEWKPLPIPEVGRTIKATLRDGRVETFKVRKVEDASAWVHIWKADSYDGARYIQPVRDVRLLGPTAIIDWEYVDKPAISAEQLSVMAQTIEDRCWCQVCGSGDEHVRELLAKAGLTVAGGFND